MALIIKLGARKPISRSAALDATTAENGVGGIEGRPAYLFGIGQFNCFFSKQEAQRSVDGWGLQPTCAIFHDGINGWFYQRAGKHVVGTWQTEQDARKAAAEVLASQRALADEPAIDKEKETREILQILIHRLCDRSPLSGVLFGDLRERIDAVLCE